MSAVTELHPVLAELEARAGASDENRGAWLLERMNGITATQIRDLYLRKITIEALVKEKLSGKIDPPLTAAVVVWGNEREPVIAAEVEARYGIRPERRVFRAADNPRYLASPDGVGMDFDEQLLVEEVKTAGMDVSVGSPSYVKKGYGPQQQWSMRVIGARRSLFAWEERIEVAPGKFEAGALRFEWVEWDDALAAELEAIAVAFFEAYDAAIAAGGVVVAEVDEELDTLAVNYLVAKDKEIEGKKAKETAWAGLKKGLADHAKFSQESPLARITWTRGGTVDGTPTVLESLVVDEGGARAAFPDAFADLEKANASVRRANQRLAKAQAAVDEVFARFTRTESVTVTEKVTVRENLTVTAVKNKEMK